MILTTGDKLALLYTYLGSQRGVARAVGLSHQQVGRILHANLMNRPMPHIRGLDKDLINVQLHALKQESKRIAREQKLPTIKLPVYAERVKLKNQGVMDNRTGEVIFTGTKVEVGRYLRGHYINKRDAFGDITKTITPDKSLLQHYERVNLLGDRVIIKHMHWLRDELRQKLITQLVDTKEYHSGSIGSTIRVADYWRQGQEREKQKGYIQTLSKVKGRIEYRKKLKSGVQYARVFTTKRPMYGFDGELIHESFNMDLSRKHASATSDDDPNTAFADQFLLQLSPDLEHARTREMQQSIRNKKRAIGKKKRR